MSKQMQKLPHNRHRFVNKMQNTTFFSNEIFVILGNLSYICIKKTKKQLEPAATDKRHKIMKKGDHNNLTILLIVVMLNGLGWYHYAKALNLTEYMNVG